MASTRRTLELIIQGITNGLGRAVGEAEAATRRLEAAERSAARARANAERATTRLAAAERTLQVARAQEEAALSRIGVAETRLEQTRDRANGATARLADAETRLDDLRRNGGSAQEIARAEEDIRRVRQESNRAALDLQRAEAALAQARASGAGATARLRAAEEAVERARRNAASSSDNLARAEAEVNRRRRELDDAGRNGRGGFRDFIAGLTAGVTTFQALGNLIGDTGTRLGGLGQVLGSLGGPIFQLVTGLLELVALLASAGEIIGVVGGLIGQALAGVPALLFAVAAAAGTVLLGLDGIKKAAQVMAPAFDRLKASVSGVFEKQLTPAFRELAKVIPTLAPSLNGVALAISGVIKNLVNLVAVGTNGLHNLQTAIGGAEAFVRGLTLGLTTFIKGFLAAAAAAAPVMNSLGEAIGSVLGKVGDVFDRLAANGTVQRAVQGLSATIRGLADVLGPIVELLIRMGAELGGTVGGALSRIGAIIQTSIPFFEHLAQVAGDLLVTAFEEIGPAIQNFIGNGLGPAQSGMDQFASFIKTTVIPAIRDFINWLAKDGLTAIKNFTLGLIIQFTEAASAVATLVSGMLRSLRDLFTFLAVTTGDQKFLKFAEAAEQAAQGVDKVKASLDGVHDKSIQLLVTTPGSEQVLTLTDRMAEVKDKAVKVSVSATGQLQVQNLADGIAGVNPKFVDVTAHALGGVEVDGLTTSISLVQDKAVTTTANVPQGDLLGKQGNQLLKGAIDQVSNKVTTTTGNVPEGPTLGTRGNQLLKGAIDLVRDKLTTTRTNVFGEPEVRSLKGAMDLVKDKTVTLSVQVKGAGAIPKFASGGLAPGGRPILVGEQGPELIVLPRGGGFVNTAAQTRALLNGPGSASRVNTGSGTGGDPIQVTVNLSQQAIAGIAEVVVQQRDRTVKRTVLAGSGVTF